MPFPKELLTPDEEAVVDLRPHWWYVTPAAIYLGIAIIVGIAVLAGASGSDATGWKILKVLVGVAVVATLVNFGIRYARWTTTNFVVTNERVISRRGVVAKRGIEIPLDRINTVKYNQTVFERMIGAGDLGIESAGEFGQETFTDIRKPSAVQHEIYRLKEAFEQRRVNRLGQTLASNMAAAPAAAVHHPQLPPSIPEQIEQLDRLRKQGMITEDEFQAKKAELLRRM